jgi:phage baseplate assembly protein W
MSNRPVYSYNDISPNATKQREIGISVQFQPNSVFISTYTTKQQVKNQLINYILTNPGERLFQPYFGSGIKNLLFQQEVDLEGLEETLQQNIENYVQNIIVNSVNITTNTTRTNAINININYSINNITDELNVELNPSTV